MRIHIDERVTQEGDSRIRRALCVFCPFCGNGERIQPIRVFSFPKVFRNHDAFSFRGRSLRVAFSFSERAKLGLRYCRVQIRLPLVITPFGFGIGGLSIMIPANCKQITHELRWRRPNVSQNRRYSPIDRV